MNKKDKKALLDLMREKQIAFHGVSRYIAIEAFTKTDTPMMREGRRVKWTMLKQELLDLASLCDSITVSFEFVTENAMIEVAPGTKQFHDIEYMEAYINW